MATQIVFAGIIIDNIIGHFKLFVQRNLSFFSPGPVIFGPASLGLNPLTADPGLAGDEDYGIAAVPKPGFKQEGGVQNEGFGPARASILVYELSALGEDQGVNDGVEAGQGGVFLVLGGGKNKLRKGFFVNLPLLGEYFLWQPLPQGSAGPGQIAELLGQTVDVDDGTSHLPELAGYEGLAGADTTGQADDRHYRLRGGGFGGAVFTSFIVLHAFYLHSSQLGPQAISTTTGMDKGMARLMRRRIHWARWAALDSGSSKTNSS